MLTDDDLTLELGAAFRDATTDLTYTGRTRPPRPIAVALPASAIAVGAVAVAVAVGMGNGGHDPAPHAGQPFDHSPAATNSALPHVKGTPALVTQTITLAGFQVTYQAVPGAASPVYARMDIGELPSGVQEVPLTGTEATAWTGKDPESGDNAIYLKASSRNNGQLFGLFSATWTQQQLIGLVQSGTPRAVPLVTSGQVEPGH